MTLEAQNIQLKAEIQTLKNQVFILTQELDQYSKIGEDITELLAYKPGELYVKQTVRPRLVKKAKEDSRKMKSLFYRQLCQYWRN